MTTTKTGNVLIINAHQYYPFSEGKLNASFVDKAVTLLEAKGYNTRVVTMAEAHDVEEQLAHHQWADIVLLQAPINWMGVPWSFKKYMDEVYTAGMGAPYVLAMVALPNHRRKTTAEAVRLPTLNT